MQEDTFNVLHAPAIPELSIPANSKLSDILARMAEMLDQIEQRLDGEEIFPSVQPTTTTNDILHPGLGDKSPDAIALTGSSLKLTTTRNDSDVTLTYDATSFGLPPDAQIVSTNIAISGQKRNGRTSIINTKQPCLDVNVTYNRFPVTLDARVMVATPRGDVELSKRLVISGDNSGDQVAPYQVIDRSPVAEDTRLTETLNQIESRLKRIETQTNG